ncbi:unnamed protein product [Rotaria sordida]|uniref:Calcineurin-like phosphoesterase domain-containing protein n=1 Tax=Rotaria sordida TaxID=392033 RepID=A0A818TA92_9BILA|nr:unnamed protein product [Rotaria sordida]
MVYSSAYIPYITCSGNHENAYNFSQYVTKFSMTSSHIIHMVYNGTFDAYIDPDALVHIIIGSAGCNEHHDPFGIP